jgi:hypothetical protein
MENIKPTTCYVSVEEEDFEEDDIEFYPCDNCDLPNACEDFGCAIKTGVKKRNRNIPDSAQWDF